MNARGMALLKSFEELKLESYRDLGGVWTIGWGSTKGVKEGMVITHEQAEKRLEEDLLDAEAIIKYFVKVPINENEQAALECLVFNIGAGRFADSTMLKLLNTQCRQGAADEFPKWCKARVNGQLVPVSGLLRRRMAERALFLEKPKTGDL